MLRSTAKKRKELQISRCVQETQNHDRHLESPYFHKPCRPTKRLDAQFFNVSCIELAKRLLGQVLVRKTSDGTLLKGVIVETEAYIGNEDKASHSYLGKRTARNKAMFMKPGTAYVYSVYGTYFCLNVSSQGEGAAVLLRALQPLEGSDIMQENRNYRRKEGGKPLKSHQLCNGPSKLCLSLEITKDLMNQKDLTQVDTLWIEPGDSILEENIISTKRIGVDFHGEEWANKPLRFYILGNLSVSIRDKPAELMKK